MRAAALPTPPLGSWHCSYRELRNTEVCKEDEDGGDEARRGGLYDVRAPPALPSAVVRASLCVCVRVCAH
jgi:hypothetical protein